MNFNTLNLSPALERMITKMGYTNLTEIQEKAIPVVLNNQDIIGKSHTGTGKTAAFLLPILQRLDPQLKRPQAIILCPTRELAMQVIDQVRKFATYLEGLMQHYYVVVLIYNVKFIHYEKVTLLLEHQDELLIILTVIHYD